MAGSELTPGSFVWVCERGMHGGRWGGVGGLRGGEVEVDAVGLGGRVWGVGSRRGGGGGFEGVWIVIGVGRRGFCSKGLFGGTWGLSIKHSRIIAHDESCRRYSLVNVV